MTYTKVAVSSQEDDDDDDAANCARRRSQHSQQPTNGGSSSTEAATGFSTEAALERLDEDIAALLSEYETVIRHESILQTVRHFFQHTSDTPLAWFPILLTVATVVALLLTGRPLSGLVLAAILIATVYLCVREHSLRRTELHRKVHHVLGEIRLARRLCSDWTDANYPNLCSPLSPCVTLQWTYRDGRIVNLPWALLVRDDLVILRPGQVAPAACVALSGTTFGAGETYGVAEPTEPPLKPTARPPLPDLVCRLRETPYLENLRVSLERFVQRPTTIYNLQRYLLVTRYIQVWGSVVTLALTVTVALMRHHGVFFTTAGPDQWNDFVLAPACAVLPILPLVFPALWIAVNLWGIARLQTLLGMPSLVGNKQQQCGDALDSEVLLSSATGMQQVPTTGGSGSMADAATTDADVSVGRMGVRTSGTASITVGDGEDDDDPAVAVDLDTPTYEEWTERPLPRRTVFRCWLALWRGDSRLLGRSANVVQVLGSITALCCVDKKGILSWPNPTAEKVFFLRDAADETRASVPKTTTTTTGSTVDVANNDGSAGKDSEKSNDTPPATSATATPAGHLKPSPAVIIAPSLASQTSMDSDTSQPHPNAATLKATASGAVAEVLDLTHDQHSPFRLAFDDHAWSVHLQSLKPLGLAILVNTCCPLTQAHYAQFCNHVTAVAMLDKDLVPVTNRYEIVESRLNSFMHGRCLCELAKQMGFTNSARDIFQLEGQIASYMHLQPDVVRRDIRFARQLHLASKVKVPFPHCLSVVMREQPGNALQLLTQGTADIVLDCCDDYWDGRDLRPLTAQERKRAQDFYQRSALTAYCTAFAYRPLRHGISGALAGVNANQTAYLELPPEMRYRLKQQRTPSFTYDSATTEATAAAEAARMQQHSISTDSLLRFATAGGDEAPPPHYRHQYNHYLHHQATVQSSSQQQPLNARAKRYTHHSHSGGGDSSGGSNSKAGTPAAEDDVDSCFEMQCHQVFIGMVTMQYQAQTDIVQLIERLDQACVRFVHFSKENELRSRVFSEKMGLESGWNCHISLLSSSSSRSSLPSPRHSRADPAPTATTAAPVSSASGIELNRLLTVTKDCGEATKSSSGNADAAPTSPTTANAAADDSPTTTNTDNSFEMDELPAAHRTSNDSAMDDENCRSLSSLTVSTEQSAPINFDMSNRAKLPRGIENIQPHLEHVDNVPLLVSLFTDCSAEATREMLGIMQRHGEIVVCLGSSASNANAEIFLQADCGIGVEPLYPQVCQDIAAYTEQNLVGNRRRAMAVDAASDGKDGDVECGTALQCATAPDAGDSQTISPVYLSRTLNSVACSISICRDDSLSIVALIELSRRFSNGLWSCIQFWASCACSLALLNTLCACVALPPVLTPGALLYLMGVAVPALAVTLVRTDSGEQVMHRATGKKHTQFDSGVFGFVLFCYGCKFIPSTVIMILCYCTFVSHPVIVLDTGTLYDDFKVGVQCAQSYILLAVVVHYVCISTCFVHRNFSIWRKNPASNAEWLRIAGCLIGIQLLVFVYDLLWLPGLADGAARVWPIVALLFGSVALVFAITEICKWEELKVNARAQRRARLDFGTKLGMNSPF